MSPLYRTPGGHQLGQALIGTTHSSFPAPSRQHTLIFYTVLFDMPYHHLASTSLHQLRSLPSFPFFKSTSASFSASKGKDSNLLRSRGPFRRPFVLILTRFTRQSQCHARDPRKSPLALAKCVDHLKRDAATSRNLCPSVARKWLLRNRHTD